jgi:hypothetical protein
MRQLPNGQHPVEFGQQVQKCGDRRVALPVGGVVDSAIESVQRHRADEVGTESVERWLDSDQSL